MIFDTHMHTKFSEDSKLKIEDAIKKAKELNYGIIITEHLDLNLPDGIGFKYDINEYFKEYTKYRSDSLLLGTEIGLSLNTESINLEISKNNDYDYILGSIHSIFDKNGDKDIYYNLAQQNISKHEKLTIYLNHILKCVDFCNCFDSLGHIDYICRYINYENNELLLSEFKNELSYIFKSLISKNKVLELNTSRLNSKESYKNLLDIYKFYSDLGGKYVTLGSDAHHLKDMFRNFDIAFNLLDSTSLKGVYFKERKLHYF